jgi:hypothetical protein
MDATMNEMSRADRVRRTFIRFSFLVSVCTFVMLAGTDLVDQWIAGHISARFMLGTAFLIAGVCAGLFGIIAAIGLAVSVAFNDEAPPNQQQ